MKRSYIGLFITIFALAQNNSTLGADSPDGIDLQQKLRNYIKAQQSSQRSQSAQSVLLSVGAAGLGVGSLRLLELTKTPTTTSSLALLIYPIAFLLAFKNKLENILYLEELADPIKTPHLLTLVRQEYREHKKLEQSCYCSWDKQAVFWSIATAGFGVAALVTLLKASKSEEYPRSLAGPGFLALSATSCMQRSIHNIHNIQQMKRLEDYDKVVDGALSRPSEDLRFS